MACYYSCYMIDGIITIGSKEIAFLIDLALALICGLAIGIERELRHKPAGISTHITVITASMLFSFISKSAYAGDPTRIAAQVVTGVGFLGAGMIMKSESTNTISNLTTAASVWYSAAIGMALGFDYHFIAIIATVYAILTNRIPKITHVKKPNRLTKLFKKQPDNE